METNVQIPNKITSYTILRKLSYKTKLGWGENRHLTVADVIRVNRQADLIWAYYNLSKISFVDKILDELGISAEDRITKPGTDISKGEEMVKQYETKALENQLKSNKVKFIEGFNKYRTMKAGHKKDKNARTNSKTSED